MQPLWNMCFRDSSWRSWPTSCWLPAHINGMKIIHWFYWFGLNFIGFRASVTFRGVYSSFLLPFPLNHRVCGGGFPGKRSSRRPAAPNTGTAPKKKKNHLAAPDRSWSPDPCDRPYWSVCIQTEVITQVHLRNGSSVATSRRSGRRLAWPTSGNFHFSSTAAPLRVVSLWLMEDSFRGHYPDGQLEPCGDGVSLTAEW